MRAVHVNVSVPPNLIEELERKLDGIKKPENVMKQAINTTSRKLLKEIARTVPKAYRYKGGAAAVTKASSRTTATVANPAVDLVFRGKTTEIQAFYLSPGLVKGQLLYGAVEKKRKPVLLEKGASKAFVVRFKNGHVSVVYRAEESKADPTRAQNARYKGTNQKGGYRYNKHTATLKRYNSPSIPSMVKNEKVWGKLEGKYQGVLEKEIRKVMEKALYG